MFLLTYETRNRTISSILMIIPGETLDSLAKAAKAGDETAQKELFDFLFVRFSQLTKRRTGVAEEAEDLAQEACITVLEKFKTETITKGFEQWAYGILRMKIGNYLQKSGVRKRVMASGVFIDQSPEIIRPSNNPNLYRRLKDCFQKIVKVSSQYARVLNLIYQGYKADEIGRRLNLTTGNVYVILNRGRSMLRSCLETGAV